MLIRVSGGRDGIRQYLERGQKAGREFGRDQLDERVILSGDLALTDTVIQDMRNSGEKYFHITLSFREDQIERDKLSAITDEFRQFAMTAYLPDEYNFYAEAHLPRIKSFTDKQTAQDVERKPHIHVVIPKQNLLSGTLLDPLYRPVFDKASGQLLVPEGQMQWLEAFQEHINNKYGLASPKDHPRFEYTDESTIISRLKGDIFRGDRAELKNRLLTDVLERDIINFDDFQSLVSSYGDAKLRRAGQAGEYMNVKPPGAAKGTNLKEHVFSKAFIELPTDKKRQQLAAEARAQYLEAGPARPGQAELDRRLEHWHGVRSRELKYLNPGSRKAYATYKAADPEARRQILADREAAYYERHSEGLTRAEDRAPAQLQGNVLALDSPGAEPSRATVERPQAAERADSVVGQLIREAAERGAQLVAEREAFAKIKAELDAHRLLAHLGRSHGLAIDKYPVEQAQDGSHRIVAGSRRLNVSDFLTKELHLQWSEAAPILSEVHASQLAKQPRPPVRQAPNRDLWMEFKRWQPAQREADWQAQRAGELARRADLRTQHQAEVRQVRGDRRLGSEGRKAALHSLTALRAARSRALTDSFAIERQAFKDRHKPLERYRTFLLERARAGDGEALTELRRHRDRVLELQADLSIQGLIRDSGPTALLHRLSYQVDRDGVVTYFDHQMKPILRDTGLQVCIDGSGRAATEAGLRLAIEKFGTDLVVNGSEAFRRSVVEIAVQHKLDVRFTDPSMNEYAKHLAAAREHASSGAAGTDLAKDAPTARTSQEPGQPSQTPQRPKNWDLER